LNRNKNIQIEERLEHRILHGLSCEWDNALSGLPYDQRAEMRKPFFSLSTMRNRLGFWDAARQEICLSRNFVSSSPWSAVREVLLHEMAHQFSDQVFRVHNQSPHGTAFKKACRLLCANPKAYRRHTPANPATGAGTENSNDKILRRIKKLLALAESKNPFEAENAMLKAHELTAKYNIDLIENSVEEREYRSMIIGTPALRHRREAYTLAGLLQDFYFVKGIWISAYVLEKGKMGRVLEISGTPHNITNASYIHTFVSHYIDAHWNRYKRGKNLSVHRKSDFAVGIIEGFHSTIHLQRKAMARSDRGFYPMVIEDPQLKKYFKYKYPRTASISRKSVQTNQKIHDKGFSLGRKLIVHKGIVTRKHNTRALPDK